MAQTVRDVMAEVKVRLSPRAITLRDVAKALAAARTGLAIVDVEGGGVITERDVLRAIAGGTDLDPAPAGDHMTAHPVSVPGTTPLSDACDLMIARGVRHLLVAEGGDAGRRAQHARRGRRALGRRRPSARSRPPAAPDARRARRRGSGADAG